MTETAAATWKTFLMGQTDFPVNQPSWDEYLEDFSDFGRGTPLTEAQWRAAQDAR